MTVAVGAAQTHEVRLAAEGLTLGLHCSCGYREELSDDELPLDEVTGRADAHTARAALEEAVFAHLGLGHAARLRMTEHGPRMVCSCGREWEPVPA